LIRNISKTGLLIAATVPHNIRKCCIPFWILVVESKNSLIAPRAGLPQLLTYASKSLEYQESVWGLATSGEFYQFVNIRRGNPPTYQLMPFLTLMESDSSILLLQVLKAICKL
ncbi:hypothetical protein QUA43_25520, partial [Microcoleus sp. N9_B4]